MDRTARGSSAGFVLSLLTLLVLVSLSGDATAPRMPSERDACPVCGMFVAPHVQWLAQIVSDDDTALFFDGCKDLFAYLLDPARYGAPVPADHIAAVFVTGYYDQTAIPARAALFVAGSDVLGPMGAELIPLRDRDEAEEFMKDHDGTVILHFDEVDAEVLAGLR